MRQHYFVDNFSIEKLFHRLRLKAWHLIARSDSLLVVHKGLNKGFLMNFAHRATVLLAYLKVVLVLVLVAALTGCSQSHDDDGGATVDSQETSAVEEYVPASAEGPAQNVPEPRLPAAVTENTEEGAEAALEYFWEAAQYARLTGDIHAAGLVSRSECVFCEELQLDWKSAYEDGQWIVPEGQVEVALKDTWLRTEKDVLLANIFFSIQEPPAVLYDAGGNSLEQTKPSDKSDWFALLVFEGTAQQWKIDWISLEEHVEWDE